MHHKFQSPTPIESLVQVLILYSILKIKLMECILTHTLSHSFIG